MGRKEPTVREDAIRRAILRALEGEEAGAYPRVVYRRASRVLLALARHEFDKVWARMVRTGEVLRTQRPNGTCVYTKGLEP